MNNDSESNESRVPCDTGRREETIPLSYAWLGACIQTPGVGRFIELCCDNRGYSCQLPVLKENLACVYLVAITARNNFVINHQFDPCLLCRFW